MFNFLKKALHNIYNQFTSKITALFSRTVIDEETLQELEKILISADTGIHTTRSIIKNIKTKIAQGTIKQGADLKLALGQELEDLLKIKSFEPTADIYLLVGINGSGKTTFAAKLGSWLQKQNKKVLFVAADTFRAAATEQLSAWAKKLDIPIVLGKENQDPASVVFSGCEQFKNTNSNNLIIDTAGRLQTKVNLMKELEKIKRTIIKQLPNNTVSTLLIIDSMLGQNSFEQAKIFHESTQLDGIVLTKMDGTAKGGIVFSIAQELKIPIAFISYGENPDQIDLFNAHDYATELLKQD